MSTDNDSSPKVIHTTTCDAEPGYFTDVPVQGFTYTYFWGPFGMSRPRTSTHLLLSPEAAEAKLIKREKKTIIKRAGNPMKGIHESYLPCRGEGEDRYAIDIVKSTDLAELRQQAGKSIWDTWADLKDKAEHQGGSGEEDMVFISLFDGHGSSPAVADLAKRTFNACLAWTLAELKRIDGSLDRIEMIQAITKGYQAFDADILNSPLHMLNNRITLPDNPVLSGFPNPSLAVLADLSIRGCCAINALIDVEGGKLYVSHMGDSRAVAGWYNPSSQKWKCDILTSDHRGDDHVEAERMRANHPNEPDVMLDQGHGVRVLGSRQPTRHIAGSRYNHPLGFPERMERALGAKQMVTDRPVTSPPYSIGSPDIAVRDINPANGEKLRFIIIATDGFWDRTTSEEACLLTVAHLSQPHHPPIPKTDLPYQFPHHPPSIPRPFPVEPVPGARGKTEGDWVFMDDNAATHLIRNGLGSRGWCEETRRRVLSMNADGFSSQRDDITVL